MRYLLLLTILLYCSVSFAGETEKKPIYILTKESLLKYAQTRAKRWPQEESAYWTPTQEQSNKALKELEAYLKQYEIGGRKPLPINEYIIQIMGIENKIIIKGYCSTGISEWPFDKAPRAVMGGGSCYFTADLNPATLLVEGFFLNATR